MQHVMVRQWKKMSVYCHRRSLCYFTAHLFCILLNDYFPLFACRAPVNKHVPHPFLQAPPPPPPRLTAQLCRIKRNHVNALWKGLWHHPLIASLSVFYRRTCLLPSWREIQPWIQLMPAVNGLFVYMFKRELKKEGLSLWQVANHKNIC